MRVRFIVASAVATAWTFVAVLLSLRWLGDFAGAVGIVPALIGVAGIAWVPGWLAAFLAVSLALDRQPPLRTTHPNDPVTVIIAARNERTDIVDTLRGLAQQDHVGRITVILADNGSTDGTAAVAREAARGLRLSLTVVTEPRPGKSNALNRALSDVRDALVLTLDADTLLHPTAVRRLVARMCSAPPATAAVAGSVLARNGGAGVWARMQDWDYLLGIASVKQMQSLYQSTLVAQGAFSLYRTELVRRVAGWPDAIGEDIVVTWKLMQGGGRVVVEPTAVAYTGVPVRLRHFTRQRARWARGMIEGIRTVPPWRQPSRMIGALVSVNLLVLFMDLTYTFAWLPGLALAMSGQFWVVGPNTLAVLPLTFAVNALLYRRQRRHIGDTLRLRARRNWSGLLLYVIAYQIVLSPVAVLGYAQEIARARRRWK